MRRFRLPAGRHHFSRGGLDLGLDALRPGDGVRVSLEDGSTVRFRVRSVRVYANADFPARRVYGARRGRVLNLVTCGGAYDAARGGYQANVVVSARPRATGR